MGGWVDNLRFRKYRLTPEQITRLESLAGWVWNPLDFQWEQGISYLEKYVEQECHGRVPYGYVTEDGYKLGRWVGKQRTRKDQLTPKQIIRLESFEGWVWDVLEFKWEVGFSYLKEYIEQECHAKVPHSYKTEDGYNLGTWVSMQRSIKEKLTPERITRLESLDGWVWKTKNKDKGLTN